MSTYPFSKKGEREELSEKWLRSLSREPAKSGSQSPPSQVATLRPGVPGARQLITESPRISPPNWLRKALVEKQSHDEVLKLLSHRLEGRVSEQRLQESLAVINEIARLSDGTKIVHRHLTQNLVDKLIQKGL
jgi:hypothetical protein